ncbi:MAG: hypothetical protein LUE27_06785 [Clostridia bacterium]|nr:hypothetical protein [Clostridia bacterium]
MTLYSQLPDEDIDMLTSVYVSICKAWTTLDYWSNGKKDSVIANVLDAIDIAGDKLQIVLRHAGVNFEE